MVDYDHHLSFFYCLQMNQQHFPSGVMPPFAPPSAPGGSGGHPLAPPHFNPAILNAVYQHQQMMNSASNGGSKEERRNDDQVRVSMYSITSARQFLCSEAKLVF